MRTKQLTTQEFMKLPRKEKAIMVAKDVIKQVTSEFIDVQTGNYTSPQYLDIDGSEDIKSHYEKLEGCRACALGTCLLSAVKFANTLTFGDLFVSNIGEKGRKLLLKVMGKRQMCMVEVAFEKATVGVGLDMGSKASQATLDRCIEFGERYDDPRNRLIAIMRNIIKNEGVFKP